MDYTVKKVGELANTERLDRHSEDERIWLIFGSFGEVAGEKSSM